MKNRKILSLRETCSGCFACSNICPKDAINMDERYEGYYYPHIDKDKCINCGLCDRICPVLSPISTQTCKKSFYGFVDDDEIRMRSTSGGIFGVLARMVLGDGGVVYGSAFNYDDVLRLECCSTDYVTLQELQRSKYVQSYIGNSYSSIKLDLISGRKVLFCGTPCQAAGLRAYLQKDYDNLIVLDFVCHGVPSMDLLRKHIDFLGIKNVKEIIFRSKKEDWIGNFEIYYTGRKVNRVKCVKNVWGCDEYLKLFQNYISMRRSCRQCLYCNGNRASDISLADFWGYKKYDSAIWNKKGISLILANTSKGISYLSKANDFCKEFNLKEIPYKYAAYVYEKKRDSKSSPYNTDIRDNFFKDLYNEGYIYALKKNGLYITLKEKMVFMAKQFIKNHLIIK